MTVDNPRSSFGIGGAYQGEGNGGNLTTPQIYLEGLGRTIH